MQVLTIKGLALTILMVFGPIVQATDESIGWYEDFDKAMAEAKATDKPLFLDFYAEWCGPCKVMDRKSYPDPAVLKQMKKMIAVRIDVDKHEKLALKYKGNARKYGGNGIPAMIVIDVKGNELYRHHGFLSAHQLTSALLKVANENKQ